MRRHISPAQARDSLRTRDELSDRGWRQRDIEHAVSTGRIRRLQVNRYVEESLWRELWPESRHLLEVVAAHAEMRNGNAVASHESAGVLFGLPLYRHIPASVHLTLPTGGRGPSRAGLVRHRDALREDDITMCSGIRCTTLERTTFDVVRAVGRETAVAFADAALRSVALRGEAYDIAAAEEWRERMLERLARAAGARGVRRAREVIRFADGRAQLPGESVSRLQLARLGFARFGLQVPVPGPKGKEYRVDLEIEEIGTFLEFDGKGKYLDEAMRSGRTLEAVLLDEKQREDWIRGATQRRLVRAEDSHITTPEALAARLAGFGIRLPRR